MPETKDEMDTRHRRTISVWYVVATGFVSVFIAIFIGYAYTTHVSNLAKQRTEQQRIASLKILCEWDKRQQDVYADATTTVGRAAYQSWVDLYKLLGCT
jgi:hypothetical protein